MQPLVPSIYIRKADGVRTSIQISFDEISDDLILLFENDTRENWPLKRIKLQIRHTHTLCTLENNKEAVLEIQDNQFAGFLKDKQRKKGYTGFIPWLNQAGIWVYGVIFACFIGFLLLAYFFILPFLAEMAVSFIPLAIDDKVGHLIFESNISMYENDTAQSRRVSDFAKNIHFGTERPLRFYVLRSPEENAFAIPDGSIVIYSSLLRILKSEKELAALIAHEATHVSERHTMKLLSKNAAAYLLVSVAFGDAQGVMSTLANNANSLGSLSFSRTFEEEADLKGLEILRQNRIDQQGMLDLMNTLQEHDSLNFPGFLSTHPITEKRIEYVRKAIADQPGQIQPNESLRTIFQEILKDE